MASTIVRTDLEDPVAAGTALGEQIAAQLGNEPDAVMLFTATRYDYPSLLEAIHRSANPSVLIGGSTVGAYTAAGEVDRGACAIALSSGDMSFHGCLAKGLRGHGVEAARRLLLGFRGLKRTTDSFRSAVVLIDARSGHTEEFVQELILGSHGTYQFLGGGTADDMLVKSSHVFFDRDVYTDAAVALEILSKRPLGVGVVRSWTPSGPPLRVTAAEENRLISLNAEPAVESVIAHARRTSQTFDRHAPLPFFLRNVFGQQHGNGYKLRVPLFVDDAGAIICAAEVTEGSLIQIMTTSADQAVHALGRATESARMQLAGREPDIGILFDCVTARLRNEHGFGYDVRWLKDVLGETPYGGFGTAGQIVRAEGEFGGFQNSTGVLLLFPQ